MEGAGVATPSVRRGRNDTNVQFRHAHTFRISLEFFRRYAHLRLQLCTFLLAELFVMSAPQITDPAAPLNIRSNSVRHIFPKLATSSSKARNNSSINTLLLHSVSKMETEKDNNSKSHEISVIHTWQWQRKEKFLKLDTVCSVLCMFTYT